MTVEQLRTLFETLKTKTTRASEILAIFARQHIAEDWNVNFRSSNLPVAL